MKLIIEVKSNGIHGYATFDIKNRETDARFPVYKIEDIVKKYNNEEIEHA